MFSMTEFPESASLANLLLVVAVILAFGAVYSIVSEHWAILQ